MKAAVLSKYDKSGADLELRDVPVPEPGAGEVLVRVRAAGVNPLDNMVVRGEVKLIVPYGMPLVMGNELAGEVAKVGAGVTGFAEGDRVYCRMPLAKIGAFAEYASVAASALAHVPDYLSYEQAATVPLTALTAMQAIELMGARPGDTLFISGGTGSLGAMAIPVAKVEGLTVYTNGSGKGEERVRELGADRFFDYRKQDYADELSGVDFVLDTLGGDEVARQLSIMRDGGTLVSLRGGPNAEFARRGGFPLWKRLAFGAVGRKLDRMAAERGQQYRFVFVHEDGAQLARIAQIFADRPLQTSIDATFPLDGVNDAIRKVAAGGSNGKTILTME